MKLKRRLSLTQRQAWAGRGFVLPFYFGFIFFFLTPLIQSILFCFSDVKVEIGSIVRDAIGWENFHYIFQEDPTFSTSLGSTVVQLLWQVPVIIVASLFIALILKSEFHGRTIVRSIFFLPVVLAGGIIMSIVEQDALSSQVMSGSMVSAGSMVDTNALGDFLVNLGLGEEITKIVNLIYSNMFNLLWKSGVQMIIFLAGVQSIPASLYEASSIEGATAWENFWKITIPMLGPMIMLNIFYTIIETMIDTQNPVMEKVLAEYARVNLGLASAMAWVYFLVIAVILGVIAFLFRKVNVKS